MKYRVKNSLKQEALNILLERRATTIPRIKKLILTDKEMFLAKWLKYFTLDELDYYLEPVDGDNEFITYEKEEDYSVDTPEEIEEVEESTQKEVEEYYGI